MTSQIFKIKNLILPYAAQLSTGTLALQKTPADLGREIWAFGRDACHGKIGSVSFIPPYALLFIDEEKEINQLLGGVKIDYRKGILAQGVRMPEILPKGIYETAQLSWFEKRAFLKGIDEMLYYNQKR